MTEQGVMELKQKTYLNAYCPHCFSSLNVEKKENRELTLKAKINGQEAVVNISPFLNIYSTSADITINDGDIVDDLVCPKCNTSIAVESPACGTCGSGTGKLLVAASSKMLPYYLCYKKGCDWHGLSKADEKKLSPKIPRQAMPEQDPQLRIQNHQEVPYGFTIELALLEAERCLQCKKPLCVDGCPVEIDIPSFIKLVSEKDFDGAAKKIKERNVLPAICGRVCPQESQCEIKCIVGNKEEPVAIGRLERFVADYERNMELVKAPVIKNKTSKRVAVVGSGPGGLTVAADMALLGYSVTVFEALHELGGVLTYGIPEFRLPKSIVKFEINYLKELGVRFELNHVIGTLLTIDELLADYDSVYIGVGAGLPQFMGIEGESLGNVFSSNEYLTRMNLMKAYRFPEYDTPMPRGNKVVVVGGGNVAMDCARTAIRTGSEEVYIVYRRSRQELPARIEEVHHAEEEGIKFRLLTNPVRYIGDNNNCVKAIECLRMELGEPDDSGRRRPVPVKDSNFIIECDLAVVAIGTSPNPILFNTTPNLKRNKWGYIEVNPETNETSIPNVYAGGDIVTGSATVILAMGAGRIAANAIHRKLSGN